MTARGRFITLEGIEGVGKSTQLLVLQKVFTEAGKSVVVTREPGGSPVAESIRRLILDPSIEFDANGIAELLLMFAARADHLTSTIMPALEKGAYVICDRFADASYAYQGAGRGIDGQHIAALERIVQSGLTPDSTLLLDAPVEVGLQTVVERGESDRFEKENLEFFNRVRNCYLERARAYPDRFHVVNADQPAEVVSREVEEYARGLLDTQDVD